MSEIKDDDIQKLYESLEYYSSIGVLDLKRGDKMTFKCRYCKGEAHASRSKSNGHMHIWCENCGPLVTA